MLSKNLHENKLKRMAVNPFRNIVKILSKKWYISYQYRYITHHKLDWKHLHRYTEKLQYLRLYVYPKWDLVSKCAGRVGVRDYIIDNKMGNILVPIYGIYSKFDDIDFNKLPKQFVMKCSHGCAYNYICLDKSKINLKTLKKQFDKWLSTNYGKSTLELHYSSIKPQIIIEKYLGKSPIEYKIHVFNGVAKYMYVVTNRGVDIRYNNYYIDWKEFDGAQFNGWTKTNDKISKPKLWDQMVKIAEKIASPFPFVRVDLYCINDKIYFSEMTFTPAKGTLIFDDDRADYEIGQWLDISKWTNAKKN